MQPAGRSQVESIPAAKPALTSRTILGIVIAMLPALLNLCGVELSDAETQATAGDLVTMVGAALAIYGRIKATRPLTLAPIPAPTDGALVLLALATAAALILSGCATGGTRYVESVGVNGEVSYDTVTRITTGTGGVRIYFRDGRDAKSVKPLSLRGSALDGATTLGSALRPAFRLDVEAMNAVASLEGVR